MSRFLLTGFKLIVGIGSLAMGMLIYFQAGVFINAFQAMGESQGVITVDPEALAARIQIFEDVRSKSILLIIVGVILNLEVMARSLLAPYTKEKSRNDLGR